MLRRPVLIPMFVSLCVVLVGLLSVAPSVSRSADTLVRFWATPPLPLTTEPPRINAVVFHKSQPGFALASSDNTNQPILRTIDGGKTWGATTFEPQETRYAYQVVRGAADGEFFAFAAASVMETPNGGSTWTSVPFRTNCGLISYFAPHPVFGSLIYASTQGGLLRSNDGGQNWTVLGEAPDDPGCFGGYDTGIIVPSHNSSDVVYSVIGGVVQRSADRGVTWSMANTGLPENSSVSRLLIDPSNQDTLFALAGGKPYRTTDAGQNWALLGSGLGDASLVTIALDASTSALYAADYTTIYRLDDGASAWVQEGLPAIPQPASFPVALNLVVDTSANKQLVVFYDYGIVVSVVAQARVNLPLLMNDFPRPQ